MGLGYIYIYTHTILGLYYDMVYGRFFVKSGSISSSRSAASSFGSEMADEPTCSEGKLDPLA